MCAIDVQINIAIPPKTLAIRVRFVISAPNQVGIMSAKDDIRRRKCGISCCGTRIADFRKESRQKADLLLAI